MAEAAVQSTSSSRQTADQKRLVVKADFGFWSVFGFALASIGLTYGGLLPFSTIIGMAPGSDMVIVITVAAIYSLIHAYTYAAIGSTVPQYAADYYLASRVLSKPLAFASSAMMVIFFSLAGGAVIASIPSSILPMFSNIIALLTPGIEFQNQLAQLITPNSIILVGTLGVLLVFGMCMLPPKFIRVVIMTGITLVIVAWGIICYLMVSALGSSFSDAWNQYMGSGSFLDHLNQARQLGMRSGTTMFQQIAAGLTLGFWLFYGYFNGTFFAKEVRQPEKNLLKGSWLAIVVAWAIFALSAYLVQSLVQSQEWLSAESYLYQNKVYTGLTMPWIVFYSAMMRPNVFLGGVVGFAWVFGMIALAYTFFYTASRIMLAWADDHLIPEGLAMFQPVLKTPTVTIAVVSILSFIGVLDTGLSVNQGFQSFNPVLVMTVTQLLPVTALILLPFIKREWFAQAPAIVRLKIGPLPLVSLVGVVSLIGLIWMIAAALTNPAFGGVSVSSMVLLLVSLTLALVWFFLRQNYLRTKGDQVSAPDPFKAEMKE